MADRAIPKRPWGIAALVVFFGAGSAIAFTAGASLVFPDGFLEPMWRLNPRARVAFSSMGGWAVPLLGIVCLCCGLAAAGLGRRARWGYGMAVGVLGVNLIGDAANAVLGTEPRAAFGIPVAVAMLAYLLSGRVRSQFPRRG